METKQNEIATTKRPRYCNDKATKNRLREMLRFNHPLAFIYYSSALNCYCFSDLVVPIRSNASSEGKRKKYDEWRFDSKKERGFATHLSRHRHPPHPLHRHKDELSKRRRLTVGGGRLGVSRISCCCSDLVVLIRSNASSERKRKKWDEWRFDSKNQRPHKAGLKAAAALPFTSAQSQFASKQNHKPPPKRRRRM
ncbi:hypothetical protein ACLB2K_038626 [Fragaria x ananassa]